jgi:hypothetical protein
MAVRIGATGRAWPCTDRCCSEIERGPLAGLGRPYSSLERPPRKADARRRAKVTAEILPSAKSSIVLPWDPARNPRATPRASGFVFCERKTQMALYKDGNAPMGVCAAITSVNSNHGAVSDSIGPGILFTQICGYPLFKHYRDQYRVLATPHYAMPGCVGSSHRAFFVVRADDPAERLEGLRGRIFGCNSLLSNSGTNLPRLSLARIAGGRPFFSSVVMTGAHIESLERLDERSIDI